MTYDHNEDDDDQGPKPDYTQRYITRSQTDTLSRSDADGQRTLATCSAKSVTVRKKSNIQKMSNREMKREKKYIQ